MDINERIKSNDLLLLDGSMGALLLSKGLEPTKLLSAGIEHSDILTSIHREYLEAGCDIITTNTFNITQDTLSASEFSCKELVSASLQCAINAKKNFPNATIALDIGPSGFFPDRNGNFPYERAIELFSEQINAAENVMDIIMLETTSVLGDVEAFAQAAEGAQKPLFASMTFTPKGRTWYGVALDEWISKVNSLPITVAGINCTLTPTEMLPFAKEMKIKIDKPIFAEPNRGNPINANGIMTYEMDEDTFANGLRSIYDTGINIVGGCCGSNPACMRKFKAML